MVPWKCSISSQTSQKSTAATAEPQSLKGGIQNNAESYDPKASDDAVSGICYGTGLLPVSNLVVPANAADARSGPDDVVTINRGETEFFDDYTSPVLGKVIPRNLVFEANGQLTGGFCGDHSKEYSPHVKYINPTPISETKYAFCMPVLAQYAWNWFYSMELDERYPGTSAAYNAQIAKEERGRREQLLAASQQGFGGPFRRRP